MLVDLETNKWWLSHGFVNDKDARIFQNKSNQNSNMKAPRNEEDIIREACMMDGDIHHDEGKAFKYVLHWISNQKAIANSWNPRDTNVYLKQKEQKNRPKW